MRSDLDRLMSERNLDAAMVLGSTASSPTLHYLSGGAHLEAAIIVLRPGQRPLLIHSPMERDDAVKTGLACVSAARWNLAAITREMGGALLDGKTEQIRRIMAEFGVRGRVGFYGHAEIGQAHALLSRLEDVLDDAEVVVEFDQDLFSSARITKDEAELAAMWDVARRANEVVAAVADMLSSRPVADNRLLAPGGAPLTIGHVKRFIHDECVKRELEQPGGNIFSLGSHAAIPHHSGDPATELELGKSIIFDFFPRPVGGGYFHDMTRTWSLGYANDAVQATYDDVKTVFDTVVDNLKVGRKTSDYQIMTCELFETRGHPTVMNTPGTETGYVHGLAHGLGLEVHEAPSFYPYPGNTAQLEPGLVFTVEPGLYYEDRGYGVRIEDVYYCDNNGRFGSMSTFAKDLVLPVAG
ncbi:MAG: M24 family metallopeptidase [Caldilineales bacterium]